MNDDEKMVQRFNELTSRKKWDTYKQMVGVWRCPKCNNDVTIPERCSPFPGATLHCGNCEFTLTRRTGGGQSDPFGFKLCVK